MVGRQMTVVAPNEVRLTLSSDPRYLPLIRAMVGQGASMAGFPEEECQRIVLGATEAITNVMRHTYGGRTDQPIDLRLQTSPSRFRLEIDDYGTFVDPAEIQSRALDDVRPGGLGVHLMRATMDRVEYRRNERGGTTLTLTKELQ
jgi:anti-sigma regulatory factor (Ser/Thr protein kinase)